MKTILIIDDESKLRSLLARLIRLEDIEVLEAGDIKTARKKLDLHHIDAVLCDVKLPDGHGVEFTREMKTKYPLLEIILMTAYGNIPDGVQAMKNGAFDYIIKGDDNNKILPLLSRALEKSEMAQRLHQLEQRSGHHHSFESIIGHAPALQEAVNLARKAAPTQASILLTGETGTGKEVFARAIHQASLRSNNAFVAINCSAFSKDLLESEMFGFMAGSFTGATRDKRGMFEEAHQGTLFLDEIGEMSLELQARLLRVLESGEFIKIGDTKARKADVRIIAATHRNLQEDIALGHFREDLFYRICTFIIHLPPLKERLKDIPLLTEYFIREFKPNAEDAKVKADPSFIELLQRHTWKGNIRELRNVIERSLILMDGHLLLPEHLPLEIQQLHHETPTTRKGHILSAFSLAAAEKVQIQKVLNHTRGNKTEAARLLDIGLTTLYRKMEEYNLS